jgi:hypothetical protein
MWVRLDDAGPTHPKAFRAGPAAWGFFVAALCYCNRTLSDGFIPARDLALVFPGVSQAQATKFCARLVQVGLFEVAQGGWRVHDYLDFQPSAGDVRRLRAARVEAGRLGGVRSGLSRSKREATDEASAQASAQANAEANAGAKAKQTRSKNEPRTRTRTEEARTPPLFPPPGGWV